jgi:hypothetical protein
MIHGRNPRCTQDAQALSRSHTILDRRAVAITTQERWQRHLEGETLDKNHNTLTRGDRGKYYNLRVIGETPNCAPIVLRHDT